MKKYFLTGLALLLPLTITIGVMIFIVNFLTRPFMGFMGKILSQTAIGETGLYFLSGNQVIKYGSQILILLGLFFLTLFLGLLGRWFFFKTIIFYSDKLIHKIPLVNKVYKTTQDIINNLFKTDKNSFKQVVLVPFPNQMTYSIGLISRESPKSCEKALDSSLVSVFVPTTPNPTTGFLLMYKKEDCIFLNIKTEEAIKYIVSCGVILPKEKI